MKVGYESAIGSHVGMVRLNNQDSGFAGSRLFLVADGMGGHAGGDVASSIIARLVARTDPGSQANRDTAEVQPLTDNGESQGEELPHTAELPLDAIATAAQAGDAAGRAAHSGGEGIPGSRDSSGSPNSRDSSDSPGSRGGSTDAGSTGTTPAAVRTPVSPRRDSAMSVARQLRDTVLDSNRTLRDTVDDRPELSGMGTTFTGFITVGDQLALAHIGDSRLYLLRDGVFTQITQDHTFVQRLVDSGRITEEEAKTHPRRSVLMRVLGDVDSSPDIDIDVLSTKPGDVWLLCSDGLCGYVDDPDIETIVKRRDSLQNAVDTLIDKSLAHGAPDNVTVVLVETVDAAEQPEDHGPRFAGSAANDVDEEVAVSSRSHVLTRRRGVRRAPQIEESHFEPRVDEYLAELIAEMKRRNRRRRVFWALSLLAIVAVLAGALTLGYRWTQTQYFVGTDGETVIIYQGVPQGIGSFSLYSQAENTGIPLSSLDGLERRQIERNLNADSLSDAREIVARLGDAS